MIGPAKIDERAEQTYLGWRTLTSVSELGSTIRQGIDTLYGFLGEQGVPPAGAPFIRYHVIDMANKMDVELGVPVASTVPGNDRLRPGVLPAGRYASLIYRDIAEGYAANAALLDWGEKQGLVWDRWDAPTGDAFASRYERFLNGPEDDPNPANWDSEVAIKVKDGAAN